MINLMKNYYPQIDDNVVFFRGAQIIGKITIESNCIIGEQQCRYVIKDVQKGSTVVGIPGQIIRR